MQDHNNEWRKACEASPNHTEMTIPECQRYLANRIRQEMYARDAKTYASPMYSDGYRKMAIAKPLLDPLTTDEMTEFEKKLGRPCPTDLKYYLLNISRESIYGYCAFEISPYLEKLIYEDRTFFGIRVGQNGCAYNTYLLVDNNKLADAENGEISNMRCGSFEKAIFRKLL